MFSLYFKIGIHHIADIYSYDHILFLIALVAPYLLSQFKKILILITAFTIGHTTSLILATFKIIHINSNIIEFLIPVTIFITGIWNIIVNTKENKVEIKSHISKYFTAIFFGLIHGLGFSNYLQQLLVNEKDIIIALLSFNVGIEVGQILIVGLILLTNVFMLNFIKLSRHDWINIFSGAAIGVALTLIINRLPF